MLRDVGMQTTSHGLGQRVSDALGAGSRSDRALRLADALAAAIDAEAAGALLPSLRALADATAVHRNTVRSALELLADDGVVTRAAAGRYRVVARPSTVTIVEPRHPWPWLEPEAIGLPRSVAPRRATLESLDRSMSGLVLAAEIDLDEVRRALPNAEVLGIGASDLVDVELGLADVEAAANVRNAVGQVVARVRPDLTLVAPAGAELVLAPIGEPVREPAKVRRFRVTAGTTERLLVAARIAHHDAAPERAASSASRSGSAARQSER